MTATVEETKSTEGQGGVGRIARVIGPVVDVEFPSDNMPEIYNKLEVEVTLGGETTRLDIPQAILFGSRTAIFTGLRTLRPSRSCTCP